MQHVRDTARAVMVQGTSSWAGKSLITTVLCRHYARHGLRVAPFKAQNMSNNARVVAGGEIGVAQYLQAVAAGVEPDVRMNPVLVKPEGETQSQVVVDGVVDPELSRRAWRERAPALRPVVDRALASLLHDFDLVVLEGAGSPAEINLPDVDLTNMYAARRADAAVVLVCDIDRGGAFAHVYGTWALLAPEDRARMAGFVLNRFRGDPALLPPGPARLTELTGVPMLGVVPWLEHGLPDEDGAATPAVRGGRPRVAVVRYPTASNLDELKPLEEVADVVWARSPADLDGAALVVLPGSKHVAADLRWLRASGLDAAVAARASLGGRVLGICGGCQMLGERLSDPAGVDGDAAGLGLLPLETVFAAQKLTEGLTVRFADDLPAPWRPLAGVAVDGYEIRQGRIRAHADARPALSDDRGWVVGSVLGVTLHGVLETPSAVQALVGAALARTLDEEIDALTDRVMAVLDVGAIDALAGLRTP
jgi:adenosylcobyric acid synthase